MLTLSQILKLDAAEAHKHAIALFGRDFPALVADGATDERFRGDSALIDRSLVYVEQRRQQAMRPAKFRQFMAIDSSMPPWASVLELGSISSFAEIKPISSLAGDLPMSTIAASSEQRRAFQFGCGYELTDLEVQRAAATGIPVETLKITANDTAAEQFLDSIAFTGGFLSTMQSTIKGIANWTGAPTATASTKAAGGTTWATATVAEIVKDLDALAFAVLENSKETCVADTIVLPLTRYTMAARTRSAYDQRSALDIFLASSPTVRRVVPSVKLETASGSSGTRAVAGAFSRQDLIRFVLPQGLTNSTPVRSYFATRVPQSMVVVGAVVEQASALCYMDAI